MDEIEKRARELLAAEYERDGHLGVAHTLRYGYRLTPAQDKGLAAIAAALRSAQVPEWRPIETAPRDGTAVWLYRPGQVLTDNGYVWCQLSPDNGFFACVSGGYTAVREATHWMLPLAGPSDEAAS